MKKITNFFGLWVNVLLFTLTDAVPLQLIPNGHRIVKKGRATHSISKYYILPDDLDQEQHGSILRINGGQSSNDIVNLPNVEGKPTKDGAEVNFYAVNPLDRSIEVDITLEPETLATTENNELSRRNSLADGKHNFVGRIVSGHKGQSVKQVNYVRLPLQKTITINRNIKSYHSNAHPTSYFSHNVKIYNDHDDDNDNVDYDEDAAVVNTGDLSNEATDSPNFDSTVIRSRLDENPGQYILVEDSTPSLVYEEASEDSDGEITNDFSDNEESIESNASDELVDTSGIVENDDVSIEEQSGGAIFSEFGNAVNAYAAQNIRSFWKIFNYYFHTFPASSELLIKLKNISILLNIFTHLHKLSQSNVPIEPIIEKIILILGMSKVVTGSEQYEFQSDQANIDLDCLTKCAAKHDMSKLDSDDQSLKEEYSILNLQNDRRDLDDINALISSVSPNSDSSEAPTQQFELTPHSYNVASSVTIFSNDTDVNPIVDQNIVGLVANTENIETSTAAPDNPNENSLSFENRNNFVLPLYSSENLYDTQISSKNKEVLSHPLLSSNKTVNYQPLNSTMEDIFGQPMILATKDVSGQPTITATEDVSGQPLISVTEDVSGQLIITPTEDVSDQLTISAAEDEYGPPTITATEDLSGQSLISITKDVSDQPTISAAENVSGQPTVTANEDISDQPLISVTESVSGQPTITVNKGLSNQPLISVTEDVSGQLTITPTEDESSQPSILATEVASGQPTMSTTEDVSGQSLISVTEDVSGQQTITATENGSDNQPLSTEPEEVAAQHLSPEISDGSVQPLRSQTKQNVEISNRLSDPSIDDKNLGHLPLVFNKKEVIDDTPWFIEDNNDNSLPGMIQERTSNYISRGIGVNVNDLPLVIKKKVIGDIPWIINDKNANYLPVIQKRISNDDISDLPLVIKKKEIDDIPWVIEDKIGHYLPVMFQKRINNDIGDLNVGDQPRVIKKIVNDNTPWVIEDKNGHYLPVMIQKRINDEIPKDIGDKNEDDLPLVIRKRVTDDIPWVIEDKNGNYRHVVLQKRVSDDIPWVIEDKNGHYLPVMVQKRISDNNPKDIGDENVSDLPLVIKKRVTDDIPWVIEDKNGHYLPVMVQKRISDYIPKDIEDENVSDLPLMIKKQVTNDLPWVIEDKKNYHYMPVMVQKRISDYIPKDIGEKNEDDLPLVIKKRITDDIPWVIEDKNGNYLPVIQKRISDNDMSDLPLVIKKKEIDDIPWVIEDKNGHYLPVMIQKRISDYIPKDIGDENVSDLPLMIKKKVSNDIPWVIEDKSGHYLPVMFQKRISDYIPKDIENVSDLPLMIKKRVTDDIPWVIEDRNGDYLHVVLKKRLSDDIPWVSKHEYSDYLPMVIQKRRSDDIPRDRVNENINDHLPLVIKKRISDDIPRDIGELNVNDLPLVIKKKVTDDIPWIIEDRKKYPWVKNKYDVPWSIHNQKSTLPITYYQTTTSARTKIPKLLILPNRSDDSTLKSYNDVAKFTSDIIKPKDPHGKHRPMYTLLEDQNSNSNQASSNGNLNPQVPYNVEKQTVLRIPYYSSAHVHSSGNAESGFSPVKPIYNSHYQEAYDIDNNPSWNPNSQNYPGNPQIVENIIKPIPDYYETEINGRPILYSPQNIHFNGPRPNYDIQTGASSVEDIDVPDYYDYIEMVNNRPVHKTETETNGRPSRTPKSDHTKFMNVFYEPVPNYDSEVSGFSVEDSGVHLNGQVINDADNQMFTVNPLDSSVHPDHGSSSAYTEAGYLPESLNYDSEIIGQYGKINNPNWNPNREHYPDDVQIVNSIPKYHRPHIHKHKYFENPPILNDIHNNYQPENPEKVNGIHHYPDIHQPMPVSQTDIPNYILKASASAIAHSIPPEHSNSVSDIPNNRPMAVSEVNLNPQITYNVKKQNIVLKPYDSNVYSHSTTDADAGYLPETHQYGLSKPHYLDIDTDIQNLPYSENQQVINDIHMPHYVDNLQSVTGVPKSHYPDNYNNYRPEHPQLVNNILNSHHRDTQNQHNLQNQQIVTVVPQLQYTDIYNQYPPENAHIDNQHYTENQQVITGIPKSHYPDIHNLPYSESQQIINDIPKPHNSDIQNQYHPENPQMVSDIHDQEIPDYDYYDHTKIVHNVPVHKTESEINGRPNIIPGPEDTNFDDLDESVLNYDSGEYGYNEYTEPENDFESGPIYRPDSVPKKIHNSDHPQYVNQQPIASNEKEAIQYHSPTPTSTENPDRSKLSLAPSYKLFSLDNIRRLHDELEKTIIANRPDASREPALFNLKNIVKLLLLAADRLGGQEGNNEWYENIFNNTLSPQDPLQLYVYNLLRHRWLHELMLLIIKNDFDMNALKSPRIISFLETWFFPENILNTLQEARQHNFNTDKYSDQTFNAKNEHIDYFDSSSHDADQSDLEKEDLKRFIFENLHNSNTAPNAQEVLGIHEDVVPHADEIVRIVKKYMHNRSITKERAKHIIQRHRIEMLKRIMLYLRQKGYPSNVISDLIHKLYTTILLDDSEKCNNHEHFEKNFFDVILPVLRNPRP